MDRLRIGFLLGFKYLDDYLGLLPHCRRLLRKALRTKRKTIERKAVPSRK